MPTQPGLTMMEGWAGKARDGRYCVEEEWVRMGKETERRWWMMGVRAVEGMNTRKGACLWATNVDGPADGKA